MRYIACEQGTPAWYAARAGRITASQFACAISVMQKASGDKVKGDPTTASDKYAAEVAIEMIGGMPWGEPIKPWVLKRGHDLEPAARLAYEAATGNIAEEAGVCMTDDGLFGYSTDGMVNPRFIKSTRELGAEEVLESCEGLIEVKCPVDGLKILRTWTTNDISEYWEQMQGGMWITGALWCDFIMYCPDLERTGKHLYCQRVVRDEVFITSLENKLMAFAERVKRCAIDFGLAPATPGAAWPFPS